MFIRRFTLLALSFVLFGSLQATTVKPWAHEGSDLQPDPAVVWGKLRNGLRYAVLPHNEPPERVSLRMLVESGSLNESDAQQGLAHFLEHMAFNGTRRFPGNEMVEYYQRLGMGFGADTNAHTSFDETVYKLELPDNSQELLADGISLLRDYADGMLLEDEEIEAERGVILSEKRARDSAGYRTAIAEYGFIFAGTEIPKRMPIGTEEVIKNVSRAEFVDYYRKWYALDRLVIVAAGAITEDQLVPLLEQYFGDMKLPDMHTPDRDLGKLSNKGLHAKVHLEREMPHATVSVQTLTHFDEGPDSQSRRVKRLHTQLAQAIIDRRLEKLSKQPDAVFTSGSAYTWEFLGFLEVSGIELIAEQRHYMEAFQLAEKELRRALEYGFTSGELAEAVANRRNQLQVAAQSAATRKSRDLSSAIVSSISDHEVFTSPQQDLDFFNAVAADIDREAVQGALKEAWETDNRLLFASGKLDETASEESLLSAYQESQSTAVEPPAETAQQAFAYDEPGERGRAVREHYHEDLEVLQTTLQNHVRVNYKQTDFEENIIHITIRFGGGLLDAVNVPEGLPKLAEAAFIEGGLEAHSQDELQSIFAGKSVGASFSVGDSAFHLDATTTPRDFWLQMKLLTAYLRAPGYRQEALAQVHKEFDALYARLTQTAEGVVGNEVARKLASGDKRFGYPQLGALKELSMEDIKAWLSYPLGKAYMEVSIVGDFDKQRALAIVDKTLGTLPERAQDKPEYTAERTVKLPAPGNYTFDVNTEIERAFALSYLPTTSMQDIHKTRRLGLLANVLDDRLRVKIREEIGESYSPYAYNKPSDTFSDYGYTLSVVNVRPEQGDIITGVLAELIAGMATNAVTDDELERARNPLLNQLEEYVRNNRYWLERVLAESQANPERLDWARSIIDDYKAITVDELNQLASKYYDPERLINVIVRPLE